MWGIVLALVVGGILLLTAEIFVPGLIVGLIGGLCLVVAVILAYAHLGVGAGNFVLGFIILGSLGFIAWWLKYAPRTWFARRMTLHEQLPATGETPPVAAGEQGEALTSLRPAGFARIAGRRLHVVAESGFIPEGTSVRVVGGDGMRVVVRDAS